MTTLINDIQRSKECKKILKIIMATYAEEMDKFISSNCCISSDDIILMIMDLNISVSTSIYFSIQHFFPNLELKFDFIKAKIINKLSSSFDEVKNHGKNENHNK